MSVPYALADSFIVARDESGVVRVMFNMCLHRGMQVCRAEMGNASHFRCPCHAWTYRNDGRLVGLSFHEEAYGGEDGFARRGQSLLPAPSMNIHNGLIFISLDPDALPLREYLGFDSLADMGHFDEDLYSLRKRVQRLTTDHAWTEDPPSRTRHFVTNIRTFRHLTSELRV